MVSYKFDGLEEEVSLPDEFLSVEQVEAAFRSLVKIGKTNLDVQDPQSLRVLAQSVAGSSCPDLGKLRWSIHNQEQLNSMYEQLAKVLNSTMGIGDEVISEVEAKKPEAEKGTQRGRPRSKNK